jgi:transcriptional regulator with XRE-family HTH domain
MIEKMTKEELIKKIGLKIREIRENKGMTIQELSDKLNIEYNNLIRIEKGRTNPTIGTLYKVSETLNVSIIELIDVK